MSSSGVGVLMILFMHIVALRLKWNKCREDDLQMFDRRSLSHRTPVCILADRVFSEKCSSLCLSFDPIRQDLLIFFTSCTINILNVWYLQSGDFRSTVNHGPIFRTDEGIFHTVAVCDMIRAEVRCPAKFYFVLHRSDTKADDLCGLRRPACLDWSPASVKQVDTTSGIAASNL